MTLILDGSMSSPVGAQYFRLVDESFVAGF
jgi:hypothetical protein